MDDTEFVQMKTQINRLREESKNQKEAYDELMAQVRALLEEKGEGADETLKQQVTRIETRLRNRPLKLVEPKKFNGT